MALACCRFHSTAWTVIQEKLLCLYYLQCVQGLLPSDHSPRENFCQWFIAQTAEPLFVSSVLFTNEATFRKRDEITNLQNQHLWANQNPHGTIQARDRHQFTINVWAGIVGDCLVMSIHSPSTSYRDFILSTLPALLKGCNSDNINMHVVHAWWSSSTFEWLTSTTKDG